MFGLGPFELLIILVLVLFFYGGKKLPQIGDGLGRGIREFKKAVRGEDDALKKVPETPSAVEQRPEEAAQTAHPIQTPAEPAGSDDIVSKPDNS